MASFRQQQYYYKKDIKILKNSGFFGGSIDPCLYVKKSVKDIIYVALYVDDNLMIGDVAALHDIIEALKTKGLVLKIVEGLQEHLSFKIKFSEDKKRAWLGQPHQIKILKEIQQADTRCLESQDSCYS